MKSTVISFDQVCLAYPVYQAGSRLVSSQILNSITGGKLVSGANGHVQVQALDNINFNLFEGDRLAVLGHNGSGKTTLLRAVRGIYPPSSGTILSKGRIGSLIDISMGINPEVSGRDNIFIRGMLMGIPKKEVNEKLHQIIAFSELGEFIDMPVRTYSSGMQMRLAFAVSTIIEPDILIMDEWLSVGDENFLSKAENRINQMISKTKALVIATHSRSLAEHTCNKALWLEKGKQIAFGDVDEIVPLYFDATA